MLIPNFILGKRKAKLSRNEREVVKLVKDSDNTERLPKCVVAARQTSQYLVTEHWSNSGAYQGRQ